MLVAERTRCKNRIRAVLANELLPPYEGDLCDTRGRAYLQRCELCPTARSLVDSDLRLLEATQQELDALDKSLVAEAYNSQDVRLLMTLPGIGYEIALTVAAALGDIRRFSSPDQAAAYLGLVPSTRQSGQHCYHGPITKRGNSKARWMLIQGVQHLDTNPGPLGVFFRRMLRKKNRNVAVVASARKLVTIAWHMLKKNEPYRYALPMPTQDKLSRLRVQATGKKRKTGPAKGSAPAPHSEGRSVRSVPALASVYQSEGLPAPTSLKEIAAAERRMLSQAGVSQWVESLQQPGVRACRTRSKGEQAHHEQDQKSKT